MTENPIIGYLFAGVIVFAGFKVLMGLFALVGSYFVEVNRSLLHQNIELKLPEIIATSLSVAFWAWMNYSYGNILAFFVLSDWLLRFVIRFFR